MQRIADKTKKKETLLQELRACCHAIEMAHGVGSAHIGLKKQHVKGLKERYDEQRAHVHAIHAANVAGQLPPGAQLHVGLDCELMSAVRTRAAYLETLVLEKLSAPLRPRSLAVVLTRCTEQLNDAIGQRNEVVQRLPTMPMEERFARVFGLRLPEGFDNQYRDYVDASYQYTDDSIHFSRMICDDLTIYGGRVREAYQKTLKRRERRHVMMVPVVHWTDQEHEGLLPPKENYSSWYTGFLYRVPHTKGRVLAKAWHALRRLVRAGLKHASCGLRMHYAAR